MDKRKPIKRYSFTRTANNLFNWRRRHVEKAHAQRVVFVAKRNGSLIQLPCDVCGSRKSEAHHEDYSKPLDVLWLCRKHHQDADRERRARIDKITVPNSI